jgi:3-hydroxymyristoyl/3-hydroxydecanoyl-(acyl carrier protein) dehydratase
MSLISKENIQKFVPQYPPFLMVDTLESYEEKKAISSFTILDSNILLEDGFFTEAGMLENIAQTCALHSGYSFLSNISENNSSEHDKKAPVGFIGAIKDFSFTQKISVGDTIFTHIVIEHTIGVASVVKGSIFLSDQQIASCEMKIFLAE